MAKSNIVKKFFHIMYNVGASVVILGALGKILHMPILGISGGTLLMIGLGAEAIIFFLSAFEPLPVELDWTKVYPELAGGDATATYDSLNADAHDAGNEQGLLSQKLDNLMAEAGLDAQLMQNLSNSIMSFKGAAENIAPAADAIASTNKYNEQLSLAAGQLETLNNLYKVQLESTSRQAEVNAEVVDPKHFDERNVVDFKGDVCIVPPNSFALARTVEYFRIPRNVLAICLGKSTYARCGIIVNVTPFEPEFEGHITIEISNTTPLPAKIYANEGIAQVIFFEGDEVCEVSYKDKSGKYQKQRGITLPKILGSS